MAVIKPTVEKILKNFTSLTANGEDEIFVAAFENVSITATVATGSGTWEVLATNDEDANGAAQNYVSIVAAAATVAKELTAGFRWIKVKFVLGTSASGRAAVYGYRKD